MRFQVTKFLLQSASSDKNDLHYDAIDPRITSGKIRVHFDDIRKLADTSVDKSDRIKLKQNMVLNLVNECYGFDVVVFTYQQLEFLLANNPDLRNFVKDLKFAIGGLSNMMDDYVNAGIDYDTWEAICEGRKTIKTYHKGKAVRIKIAADIYKSAQADENELEMAMESGLGPAVKIDLFQTQDLPRDELMKNSLLTDKEKHHAANKVSLKRFKSSELKRWQQNPGEYKFPQVK